MNKRCCCCTGSQWGSGPISLIGIRPRRRKIPLSRATHTRGHIPLPGGRSVPCESRLEADFVKAVARLPELEGIVSQPITVDYRCPCARSHYTPDYLVELSAVPDALALWGFAKRTYIECKPAARIAKAFGKLQMATRVIALLSDAPLLVFDERDIAAMKGVAHVHL